MSVDTRLRDYLAEMSRQREAQRRDTGPLPGGGGGGTSGGMTDDWKASVDRQLDQLHGDVRSMLYGLIGGALLLAGLIGGLYVREDVKFEAIEQKAQARAERMDDRLRQVDDRLSKIEATLAGIDAKLGGRAATVRGE